MLSLLPHPAVVQLLRCQTLARTRRVLDRLATPRRIMLSVAALLLAVLWLGNATLSILFRDALDPAMLRRYLPLGLLAYAVWHVVKAAYQRPEAGIEWTTAEQEMLCAKPLRRRDLVLYRFATIGLSALVKATLMVVLMAPDLRLPLVNWVGALLALFVLDLWRMGVEIVAWGMPDSLYRRLRAGVLTSLAVMGVAGLTIALRSPGADEAARSAGALDLAMLSLQALAQLGATTLGRALLSVPQVLSQVILAQQYDAALLGWLMLSLAMVGATGAVVVRLDGWFAAATLRREKDAYATLQRGDEREAPRHGELHLAGIPRFGGVGLIVWRQWQGVRRYASSVLVALAVPAVLSCLPWLAAADAASTLWNVAGGLAFYSFLLLPSALRFDFRRELERMVLLKSLPLRPAAVVLGQLCTPVAIATLLQTAVVAATTVVFRVPPELAATALVMLAAANVLIFALDNLIYLWFPHHLNQEGIVIFLRTTLTFTAKGLLFAAALAVVVGWAVASAHLADCGGVRRELLFLGGVLTLFLASSAALFGLLVRAYRRFDPSQDVPG